MLRYDVTSNTRIEMSRSVPEIVAALASGELNNYILANRRVTLQAYYASGVTNKHLKAAGVQFTKDGKPSCCRKAPMLRRGKKSTRNGGKYVRGPSETDIRVAKRKIATKIRREHRQKEINENKRKKTQQKQLLAKVSFEKIYRKEAMCPGGKFQTLSCGDERACREYLHKQMRAQKPPFQVLNDDGDPYNVLKATGPFATPAAKCRGIQRELDAHIEKTTGKRKRSCPVEKPFGTDHVKEIVKRVSGFLERMKSPFFTNHTKTRKVLKTRIHDFLESNHFDQDGDGEWELENMTEVQYKKMCTIVSSTELVVTYLETYERASNVKLKMKDHLTQYYPVHPEWTEGDASMNPRDENGVLEYPDGLPADKEGHDRMLREMVDVAVQWKEHACLYDNHPKNWINLLERKPNAQEFVNEFQRLYGNFEHCTTRDGKRIIDANKPVKRKPGRPRKYPPPERKTDSRGRTRAGHAQTDEILQELPRKRQKVTNGKKHRRPKKKETPVPRSTTAADMLKEIESGGKIAFNSGGHTLHRGGLQDTSNPNGLNLKGRTPDIEEAKLRELNRILELSDDESDDDLEPNKLAELNRILELSDDESDDELEPNKLAELERILELSDDESDDVNDAERDLYLDGTEISDINISAWASLAD